ncbi:TatD family hydrolase, partial [Pseudomonas aeruginosa]|uniref:TatD family hydrolase n=1 Tax=Pseudomonas aeruginosa TaxID=287 RepID=UPI00188AD220
EFLGVELFRRSRRGVKLTEAIVLETDAPDMAPSMHPGQRNSPEHLPAICRALAELRGVDAEELAASSSRNAAELFGWD